MFEYENKIDLELPSNSEIDKDLIESLYTINNKVFNISQNLKPKYKRKSVCVRINVNAYKSIRGLDTLEDLLKNGYEVERVDKMHSSDEISVSIYILRKEID